LSGVPTEWRARNRSQERVLSGRLTAASVQICDKKIEPILGTYQIHKKILLPFNVVRITEKRRADLVEY
jgi:hypothetical protein